MIPYLTFKDLALPYKLFTAQNTFASHHVHRNHHENPHNEVLKCDF